MNTLKSQAFGGQLLQAQLMGKDIFYCPTEIAAPPTPTRAGVPVLFPQFATRGPLVKHGFARLHEWQMFTPLEGYISASLLLTEQPDWPHRAQLHVDSSIEDEHLDIHFKIRNVGDSDFSWTGGLHPYFLVGDATQTQIKGLELDMAQQDLPHTEFTREFPAGASIEIDSSQLKVRIEQQGFDSWMIWNPSGQHTLKDIPHADWQQFLCVEPVNLQPTLLKSGEEWLGSMKIVLL